MPTFTLDSADPNPDATQYLLAVTATADDGRTLQGGGTVGAPEPGQDLHAYLGQRATDIAAGLLKQLDAPSPVAPPAPAPVDVSKIVIDPAAVQALAQ